MATAVFIFSKKLQYSNPKKRLMQGASPEQQQPKQATATNLQALWCGAVACWRGWLGESSEEL